MASIRFARIAPASDARTMSNSPARSATNPIISSGALPKVAFSSPPIASPVRVAICSVDSTMRRAIGRIDNAAEKNSNGAGACAYSSASDAGMKIRSQFMSGPGRARLRVDQPADDGEEEPGGPPAHQDPRQRLDSALEPVTRRQDDVAIARRG